MLKDSEERKRIEKLEFLDEIEEWQLIMGHYYIALAKNLRTKDVDSVKLEKFQ